MTGTHTVVAEGTTHMGHRYWSVTCARYGQTVLVAVDHPLCPCCDRKVTP